MELDRLCGQVVRVEVEDAELMRASVEDPAGFETVFSRYYEVIWRYLARLGGVAHADDLAGEVFLVAFARRSAFDPALGSLRSWLYGIASNVSRSHARSERRRTRAFARVAIQAVPGASPIEVAGEHLASREEVAEVVKALGRLGASDREVIVLYASEELSYEEIASVLGVEIGTVRSRLSRARVRLRELSGLSGKEARNG